MIKLRSREGKWLIQEPKDGQALIVVIITGRAIMIFTAWVVSGCYSQKHVLWSLIAWVCIQLLPLTNCTTMSNVFNSQHVVCI